MLSAEPAAAQQPASPPESTLAPAQATSPVPPPALSLGPLVVASTPGQSLESSRVAIQALQRFARQRGTALLDLTPADDAAPRARESLRRGIEDYQAFKFTTSLEHLNAGIVEASRTGGQGLFPSELSDLLIYRALVLTELGDAARAWEDFVRAVVLDPSRRLDAARFPPRATEPFSRAVAQVSAGEDSALTITLGAVSASGTTAETPCQIFLDGRAIAAGDPHSVKWGEHYVRIACPGYLPYGAVVLIKESSRSLAPALRQRATPSAADGLRVARRQGASALIWARAHPARWQNPDSVHATHRRGVRKTPAPGHDARRAGAVASRSSPLPPS